MPKLIILRGNSGSGKSTVAKALREQSKSGRKIAIVEQDYLRRFVLKEKEHDNGDNIALIKQTVEYALNHDYDVILEGILYTPRYREVIIQLLGQAPDHWVYYFDVSLKETLKRHETKHNAREFGEKEMRGWYNEVNHLGIEDEIIIPESSSLEESVGRILAETKL